MELENGTFSRGGGSNELMHLSPLCFCACNCSFRKYPSCLPLHSACHFHLGGFVVCFCYPHFGGLSRYFQAMLTKDHATTETGVKETVSMTYATVGSILLGLGVSLGFGLGGLYAMGDSWMQLNEVIDAYYTMTPVRQT